MQLPVLRMAVTQPSIVAAKRPSHLLHQPLLTQPLRRQLLGLVMPLPMSRNQHSQLSQHPMHSQVRPAVESKRCNASRESVHVRARLVHVLCWVGGDQAASICCIAAGMQCVLDKASAPVCALAFGRLDSALLAFGADDGVVRIARINEHKASILHVR
jgi:hypothetical protein